MALLSIPSATPSGDQGAESARPGLAAQAVGRWIPALVGLVLAGLLHMETRPSDDLQLLVPGAARPGHSLAYRTFLFAGDGRAGEAGPVDAPGEVRLITESGAVLSTSLPRRSPRFGQEGEIAVPATALGRHIVEARAWPEGREEVRVRRPVDIQPDANPLPRRRRLANPLQHLELGPTRALVGEREPPRLDVRIGGGVCVPETVCDVMVWAGASTVEVRVEGNGPGAPGAVESEGIVQVRGYRVLGPEASVDIVASSGGADVARRSVRLPVALATPSVRIDRSVDDWANGRRVLHFRDPLAREEAWVVDLFHEGHWEETFTMLPDEDGQVDLGHLGHPGFWHAQIRRDPFAGTEPATLAFFLWGGRGTWRDAIREIAARSRASGWDDPMAEEVEELLLDDALDADAVARFMLALDERESFVLPMVVHGVEQSAEPSRLARLRRYGALLMLLLGLLVSYLLVTAQLRAGEDLDRALIAAGIDDETLPVSRFRRWLLPLSAALFVLLVFGVVAYMVVSRGTW